MKQVNVRIMVKLYYRQQTQPAQDIPSVDGASERIIKKTVENLQYLCYKCALKVVKRMKLNIKRFFN